jgi:[acyl-carrier-protein] S-malonyltransferase
MGKIGFLFSGSGAQHSGMMRDLYEHIGECKILADRLSQKFGESITDICFSEGDAINEPMNMFISVFSTEMVINKALQINGIIPDIALGFSLGEWAAIASAGVLDLDTAVELIKIRSKAMIDNTPEGAGMMVILGKGNDEVNQLCSSIEGVFPSNYNYEGQVTVSGTKEGLDRLEKYAVNNGIIVKRIPVRVMSHCPMMRAASEIIASALEGASFATPKYPIISNCTAQTTVSPTELKNNLIRQLVEPVLFEQSFIEMISKGVSTVVEVGPGHTLSNFAKKIAKKRGYDIEVYQVEDMESLSVVIDCFKGKSYE